MLAAAIFALGIAAPALASSSGDWDSFAASLRRRHKPVFLNACRTGSDTVVVVAFPLGSVEGRYFGLRFHKDESITVLSDGPVAVKDGKLVNDFFMDTMIRRLIASMKLTTFSQNEPRFEDAPLCRPIPDGGN
jgi:hypothetical protein